MDREMDMQRDWVDEKHEDCDEETRTAIAYSRLGNQSKVLGLLSRYHSRVRRDFEKAIRDLEHIRTSKTLTQPKLPNEPKTAIHKPVPVAVNSPLPRIPNEPNPAPVPAATTRWEPPQVPDQPSPLRIVTNPTNRGITP
jgi:hypothetical protein